MYNYVLTSQCVQVNLIDIKPGSFICAKTFNYIVSTRECVPVSLQISEMNTQLAQARLKTDKDKDEARKLQEELAAVKKVAACRCSHRPCCQLPYDAPEECVCGTSHFGEVLALEATSCNIHDV